MLQIEQVITKTAEHLLHRIRIAIVERSIRSHPRTNLIKKPITRILFHNPIDVEFAFGTRTDKSHIANEYIPQLGKLIQMVLAKELSYSGQSGILSTRIQGRTKLLRIQPHALELVDIERTSKTTNPLLFENSRTTILPLHGQITE